MGRIRQSSTGREHPLPARMLVGRAPTCFLRVDRPEVSGEHALIQWTVDGWRVRDLGSRNGTLVNGAWLTSGESAFIERGASISFGDAGENWILVDDTAPTAMAVDLQSRELVVAEHGLLALPSDAAPEVTIYTGASNEVLAEIDAEKRVITDGEVIGAGGRSFCILLVDSIEATPLVELDLAFENLTFHFAVTRNEEHVELAISSRGRRTELGAHDHHYPLLLLARARRAQAEAGSGERGWVEISELLRMLRMRENTLNVSVHRARQALAAVGVGGAANVVEIKPRRRRFGSDKVEIRALD